MSQEKRKVAVVTDGACSLTPALGREYGVHVAPVYVTFGDRTWQAGVNLDADEFYRLLRSSGRLPMTAQPTAQDFERLFKALAQQAEAIVAVVISPHMSATLDSALAAKAQLPDIPIHG